MSKFVTNFSESPGDQPTRSLEQARNWFRSEGISVREWAEQQGFVPGEVYAFLHGRTKGYRGNAHKVAIALRVKPLPAIQADVRIQPRHTTPRRWRTWPDTTFK
jgi:gp16 family phage-associated protein